jgi:hypothetical protein
VQAVSLQEGLSMKFDSESVLSTARHLLSLLLVAVAVSGCCLLSPRDDTTVQKSLVDVVDAIQLAVDIAAKDDVWKATDEEQKHWGAACSKSKEVAAVSCGGMLVRADALCQGLCQRGGCGYAFEQRCKALADGQGSESLCAAGSGGDGQWCKFATPCARDRAEVTRTCDAAASIAVPSLKQAVLSVAVERSKEASAGVDILVVSFGASQSRAATNTIEMTLKPRVRDSKYGVAVLPMMPKVRDVSPAAKALAEDLTKLIVNSVQAAVKEYDEQGKARAPTAMAELTIEFSLVIDQSGKLGLKKTWEAASVGIDLGAKSGLKSTNTLKIQYARAE